MPLSTANLDSPTDSPRLARADLLAAVQALNNIYDTATSTLSVTAVNAALAGRVDDSALAPALRTALSQTQRPGKLEPIANRCGIPANTLPAASIAFSHGMPSVACDLRVSSDGVVFLATDSTVDAATEGTGAVAALTAAYLDTCVVSSTIGTVIAGTTLTRFSSLLSLAATNANRVYARIREYRTQADLSIMLSDVQTAGMEDATVFQSALLSDLQQIRSLNSKVGVALVGDSSTADPSATFVTLASLGRAYVTWDFSDLENRPFILSVARNNGLAVIADKVLNTSHARRAARLGVSRIVTDVFLSRL